ncbi:MAG: hypothetical protein FJ053_03650 [Cyanobacteria bacterium M_surface_10_m1_298]|nr:hypothetical protein [Cyanobacteria bacterium M_surface_10_m1_298]
MAEFPTSELWDERGQPLNRRRDQRMKVGSVLPLRPATLRWVEPLGDQQMVGVQFEQPLSQLPPLVPTGPKP